MRIEQPYYLLLLLLIPAAIWIFRRFMKWRSFVFSEWGSAAMLEKIFPGISSVRPLFKFAGLMIALAFVILALSNFQLPSAASEEKRQGVDVSILMDVSTSMLCDDVDPNRLSVAKEFASQILSGSPENRISLVAFAGTAITMVPLTPDHSAAEMILNSINTNTIPEQGSDIGNAIREAIRSLPDNQNHYRAVILVSDGEDQDRGIDEAIYLASKTSTVIFTVGIGTSRGGNIPLNEPDGSIAVKKNAEGETVITKLHPEILQQIARKTSGSYYQYQVRDRSVSSVILKQVAAIGSNSYSQKILSGYKSQFQFFLFPALLLLILELFIRNRKVR